MSAPALGSNLFSRETGTTRTINVSTIADGSWMIASHFQGDSSNLTVTGPAGWTQLVARQVIGSRSFTLWGRIKQPGDGSMVWTTSGSTTVSLVIAYGAGSPAEVTSWVVGLVGVRSAGDAVPGRSVQAGTSTTNVAPPVTVPANTRIITVSLEATSAAESNISSVSGATAWLYINPTNAVESTFLASVETDSDATTSAVTISYVNAVASNGGAVQIGVPSDVPEPASSDASGAYAFGGTATGSTVPTATGIGTFEYGGTADGQRASEATASGAWSLGGTAAGSQASEGAAVGGWAVAGSASSSSTPEGVAVGTFTFTATAEGSTVASGAAAGAVNFGGAAAGSIVATGTAAGAYAFAGSATSAQPVTFPSIRTLTSAAPTRTITGAAAGRTLDGITLDRTLIGAVP